jgi:hypothetical protein
MHMIGQLQNHSRFTAREIAPKYSLYRPIGVKNWSLTLILKVPPLACRVASVKIVLSHTCPTHCCVKWSSALTKVVNISFHKDVLSALEVQSDFKQ